MDDEHCIPSELQYQIEMSITQGAGFSDSRFSIFHGGEEFIKRCKEEATLFSLRKYLAVAQEQREIKLGGGKKYWDAHCYQMPLNHIEEFPRAFNIDPNNPASIDKAVEKYWQDFRTSLSQRLGAVA